MSGRSIHEFRVGTNIYDFSKSLPGYRCHATTKAFDMSMEIFKTWINEQSIWGSMKGTSIYGFFECQPAHRFNRRIKNMMCSGRAWKKLEMKVQCIASWMELPFTTFFCIHHRHSKCFCTRKNRCEGALFEWSDVEYTDAAPRWCR